MTTLSESSNTARIDRLETELQSFISEQRAQNSYVNAFINEQRQVNAEQREHNARFDAFIGEQREHNARFDAFIDEQRQVNAEQREHNARSDARMDRMQDNISILLGTHDEQKVKDDADGIAYHMGYAFVRTLSKSDLLAMYRHQDTTDLDSGALHSFREADLVIEAAASDGDTHYIAMEISHTADERDTGRALRNAGLVTRFTGRPAHPAIASMRNDRNIQHLVDNGTIYWRPILQDP